MSAKDEKTPKEQKVASPTIMDKLKTKWLTKRNININTPGGRLVCNFLTRYSGTDLSIAILEDNVDNFNKYFTLSPHVGNIRCLELCCLCGSERIIRECYLNNPENINCLLLSDGVIAYAMSSGNENMALTLAVEAIALGRQHPGNIYLYTFKSYQLAKKIQSMFELNKRARLTY